MTYSQVPLGALLLCAGGKSLLMLLPSEKEAMLKQLEDAKVPLKPLKINPNKTQPVSPALQALLSKNNDLKVCHGEHTDPALLLRDRC